MSFLQMTRGEACSDQEIFLAAGGDRGLNLGPLAQEASTLTTQLHRFQILTNHKLRGLLVTLFSSFDSWKTGKQQINVDFVNYNVATKTNDSKHYLEFTLVKRHSKLCPYCQKLRSCFYITKFNAIGNVFPRDHIFSVFTIRNHFLLLPLLLLFEELVSTGRFALYSGSFRPIFMLDRFGLGMWVVSTRHTISGTGMTSLTLCFLLLKCQMIVCPSSLHSCVQGTNSPPTPPPIRTPW